MRMQREHQHSFARTGPTPLGEQVLDAIGAGTATAVGSSNAIATGPTTAVVTGSVTLFTASGPSGSFSSSTSSATALAS